MKILSKVSEVFFGKGEKMSKDKLFWMLAGVSAVALIAANICVSHILTVEIPLIGTIMFTGAMFTFPITCIIDDVLTEVFGWRANRSMWFSFILMFACAIYFKLLGGAEAGLPDLWSAGIASMGAFICSSWINSAVLIKLKKWAQGKGRFLRFLTSTAIGQFCDTLIWTILAVLTGVFGTVTLQEGFALGFAIFPAEYGIKLIYEAISYFFITKHLLKKIEKMPQK